MSNKTLKSLNEDEIKGVKAYLLNNCKSTSSSTKGKSASELGFNTDDLKAIEIKFDYEFGTDKFTIFCQKESDKTGRGFSISQIDENMYDVIFLFYIETRKNRKTRATDIMSMINSGISSTYIDPDFVDDRED